MSAPLKASVRKAGLLALLGLSACSPTARALFNGSGTAGHVVAVNELNNNQTIRLRVGDELAVYLPFSTWVLLQNVSPTLIAHYRAVRPTSVSNVTPFFYEANITGTETLSFAARTGVYTTTANSYTLHVVVVPANVALTQ